MDTIQVRLFKVISNAGILFLFTISCSSQSIEVCNYELNYESDEINVYRWNWGVNGNNQQIAITDRKLKQMGEVDEKYDYIFKGSFPIFVKVDNDTLSIYAYKKAIVPNRMNLKKLKIAQLEIDNPINMKLQADSTYMNLRRLCLD